MYLHALTTAVPSARYTQADCWEIVQRSEVRHRLNRKSLFVLQSVLNGDTGIATRHFATRDVERLLDLGSDELNAAFRDQGPRLAVEALAPALDAASVRPADLDALFVCTCTGYLCPGLSSYIAEQLGLRPDAYLHDVVGLGCGAAIPMLRAAHGFLAAQPNATVATVAVEVCSAAFYLDDDIGVLVSACLFGDGAAAAVWRGRADASDLRCTGFDTLHRPEHRDRLRFEHRDGKLRNLLHATVPQLAASAVMELYQRTCDTAGRPPDRVVSHGGGRDVLKALEQVLPGKSLESAWRILKACGNMSSPSVLFALDDALKAGPAVHRYWLVSFGAGFSAHACRLERSGAPA